MTDQQSRAFDDEPVAAVQDSRAQVLRRRRNTFRNYPVPTEPMGRMPTGWFLDSGLEQYIPPALKPFADWFDDALDARERFRWALRDSLDELLDGQRTGRWAYQHLSKTEKTYLGTAVEVNLTKEFEFPNGDHLDWQISGRDIDCKYSKDLGRWEIPMEMYLCDDHGDRQGKTDLPRNLLLHLNPDARGRIFSFPSSGQKRVDQLFREVQGQIVGRQTVLTVGQQDDAPKRVRDTRLHLRPEGIVILGHQDSHPAIAATLELPVPVKGEWIAVRLAPVTPVDGRPYFTLNAQSWAVAKAADAAVAAPYLPKKLTE
jgi:hypothetical protein